MAKRKFKRPTTTFNLSFLDIMSCGFGAVVLFFMIINHATKDHNQRTNRDLISETNLLEKRLEIGRRNLAQVRNQLSEIERQRGDTQGRTDIILEELQQDREELSRLDAETLAKKENINRLQTDLKSIDEAKRRLSGSLEDSTDKGDDLRNITGSGDRLYLTGLKVGGKRILFLVDVSASMLDTTIVNIVRRRNMSEEDQRASRKWQRALGSVEWLLAKMPKDSQFQIYTFNNYVRPAIEGSEGDWLDTGSKQDVEAAVAGLDALIPANGTSLHRAFEAIKRMDPRPDNIYLLTDGLPTMGASQPLLKTASPKKRRRHFYSALDMLPAGIPINVILFPMEGDPYASAAYWRLSQLTQGSMISPAADWP
ncbi:MAG: VWA domain-containing protein [Pseudomonadota bacterium]